MEDLIKDIRENLYVIEQENKRLNKGVKQASININSATTRITKDIVSIRQLSIEARKAIKPKEKPEKQTYKPVQPDVLTSELMTSLMAKLKEDILTEIKPQNQEKIKPQTPEKIFSEYTESDIYEPSQKPNNKPDEPKRYKLTKK